MSTILLTNLSDNTTQTASVLVEQPEMATVADLKATRNASANSLSWSAVVPKSEVVTDDFESYPAFTLPGDGHYLEYEYNIGPWYNYDADQEYSLDLPVIRSLGRKRRLPSSPSIQRRSRRRTVPLRL